MPAPPAGVESSRAWWLVANSCLSRREILPECRSTAATSESNPSPRKPSSYHRIPPVRDYTEYTVNLPALALAPVASVADDEVSLVERARRGDERAFSALYHRHARYLAGVAYRLLGDALELDDIVQETFVAALRGLSSLDDPRAFRAWLVTIAVRQGTRRLAARARKRWLDRELGHTGPSSGDTRQAARVHELYQVLADLSPKLRVPWTLARIEGHELAEVASACGISLATAKRRIARAEAFITRRLDGRPT